MNSKNLVENVEETGSFTCFAYDLNNQLVKFERNGSATDFSWENGKICKSIYKDDHSEIISIFTYQGTCKGYFPPYSTYYIDSDDYEISLAHPELIGLRCSQLPSRITRQTDSGEHILNFSYNFDSDGYIETCTINEFSVFNGNPNSWTCTWNFKWQ